MIVEFSYEDRDYGENDNVLILFPDTTDMSVLNREFADFSERYMSGYEYGENLDLSEEEFKENFGISKEEGEYFSDLREGGLSSDLVVEAFLNKYPKYQGQVIQRDYSIAFDEYEGCSKAFISDDKDEDMDR